MSIDPVVTAIITGFQQRNDRIYPLRAALPTTTATFSLGESKSVLDGHRDHLRHVAADLDNGTTCNEDTVLAVVTDFAMHATAADLDSDLYDHLNHLLTEVGLTPIADANDHYRRRILDTLAAR